MKIIQEGDLRLVKKPKRFVCRNCDCIFEADSDYYRCEPSSYGDLYLAKCPTCNALISLYT